MKTGQSPPLILASSSWLKSAPDMLKRRHDEQNIVAGFNLEFADLWSCRQVARGVRKQSTPRLSGRDRIPFRHKKVSPNYNRLRPQSQTDLAWCCFNFSSLPVRQSRHAVSIPNAQPRFNINVRAPARRSGVKISFKRAEFFWRIRALPRLISSHAADDVDAWPFARPR